MVAPADEPNRHASIDGPGLKTKPRRHKTQRADHSAFGDVIARHHDAVGADRRAVGQAHIALDEMFLDRSDTVRENGDDVVDEVVARAPDLDARRQAAVVTERELTRSAARYRTARRDVRTHADPHARGEIAEVIDDRVLPDLEQVGMPN